MLSFFATKIITLLLPAVSMILQVYDDT